MRLVIDDYGYIYPKLAYLNKIVMTKKELGKIKDLSDFSGLISFAQRYFPGLKPKAETAEDFEKELWVIFFKIIEKILVSSPNMVQKFLKTYLIRFEIWNIRIAVIEILVKKEIGHQVFPFFKKPQQIL